METAAHKTFQFGEYALDDVRGCLRTADREVELRPKSFEVLRCLVENAGRLVMKAELIKAVWPNVVVTDESLTRCISEVRHAIGDGDQKIIKTVPRRGYLFAAPVSRLTADFAGTPHAAAAAVERAQASADSGQRFERPIADRPSVAVLPFVNLSGDPQQEYFSDGITEDIITELSRFSELLVIARHSTFQYKARAIDVRQIGRELGARYVLEGSIRRSGDRIRINAQLIDAVTGAHLWAERYDRELTGIFSVQDEVTQKIVVTLVAHVTKSELDRALRKPPENLAAYDCYLRANAIAKIHQRDISGESIAAARMLYEQSIAADPRYAPAFLGLANTYIVTWLNPKQYEPIAREYQDQATLDRALSLAQKAVELDGNLPDAHVTLANILHWHYRRVEAMAEFERAFELNPNLGDFRFSTALIHNGRTAEAVEDMRRIMRLDPFHPDLYFSLLGYAYYLNGLHAEALENLRTGARRMPDWRPAHVWLASAASRSGQDEEARRAAREVLRLDPGFSITKWIRMERLARQEDADRIAEDLRKAGLPE
jgi:adenylate cyclase